MSTQPAISSSLPRREASLAAPIERRAHSLGIVVPIYNEAAILEGSLERLRRVGRFAVLPAAVRTSARRFLRCGTVRQQLRKIALVALFELGVAPERLARFYPPVR